MHLRRLDPERPLSTLIKLFLLGAPVSAQEAATALDPVGTDALKEAGLLAYAGDSVRSTVRLLPHEGLVVAHDPDVWGIPHADHVFGVGPSSETLARLTVRRAIDCALDLGTGCGVQALLAARHATTVTATDVNPRALRFTEVNARLNAVNNVECRAGDLFEPVRGSTFNLIVCNPPYVVSPDTAYVYRDSGLPSDEVSRAVVSELPGFLRSGGFASIMCNWVRREGDDWSAAPRRWIVGSGCDAWLLHYRTDDPLTYAATFNQQLQGNDPEDFSKALDRWLAYYREEGIVGITSGVVILRRGPGPGPGWVRADEMPLGPTGPAGEHILRVFEAEDWRHSLPDDHSLLDEVFRLVDRHRLDQTLTYRDDGYAIDVAELVLDDGVGVVGRVAPHAVHVLFRLDGSRRLGDAINEAARETGVEPGALVSDALETVRRLLELGFLTRVGSARTRRSAMG